MIVANRPEELPPARRVIAIGTFESVLPAPVTGDSRTP